jgi:4-hydroxy-tetrahydrodipicolinate synthase
MSPASQGAIRVKAALEVQGVLNHRTTRPPLLPATEDEVAEVRTALQLAGLAGAA